MFTYGKFTSFLCLKAALLYLVAFLFLAFISTPRISSPFRLKRSMFLASSLSSLSSTLSDFSGAFFNFLGNQQSGKVGTILFDHAFVFE